MGLDRAKIGRTIREEHDREQGKAKVKWRISSEDQRGKGIQRASEKRLKRGQQQRESELRL